MARLLGLICIGATLCYIRQVFELISAPLNYSPAFTFILPTIISLNQFPFSPQLCCTNTLLSDEGDKISS